MGGISHCNARSLTSGTISVRQGHVSRSVNLKQMSILGIQNLRYVMKAQSNSRTYVEHKVANSDSSHKYSCKDSHGKCGLACIRAATLGCCSCIFAAVGAVAPCIACAA